MVEQNSSTDKKKKKRGRPNGSKDKKPPTLTGKAKGKPRNPGTPGVTPEGFKDHLWKRGQSGNPKGRPKGRLSLTALLRAKLQEVVDPETGETNADLLIRRIINEAKANGDFRFLNLALERMDGKVVTTIQANVTNTILTEMTPEKLAEIAARGTNGDDADDENES